jgi:hypothetical protein
MGQQAGPPRNLAANSNTNKFLPYVFFLTAWEMAKTTADQKLIFKVKKLVESLI